MAFAAHRESTLIIMSIPEPTHRNHNSRHIDRRQSNAHVLEFPKVPSIAGGPAAVCKLIVAAGYRFLRARTNCSCHRSLDEARNSPLVASSPHATILTSSPACSLDRAGPTNHKHTQQFVSARRTCSVTYCGCRRLILSLTIRQGSNLKTVNSGVTGVTLHVAPNRRCGSV